MSEQAAIAWNAVRPAAAPPVWNRSLVAGVNAEFRARESARPAGHRILCDDWAHLFAERDFRVRALRLGRHLSPPLWRLAEAQQTTHCVRHRSIDELVLRAVRDGFRQVVLVGAGYDMRASRFAAELAGVRWIEADHPATLERKWKLLRPSAALNLGVEIVGVDLLHQSLAESLPAGAFDPRQPACFVLEGLLHYLTMPRLEALLAALGGWLAPRRVLLSYISSDMYGRAPGLFVRLVRALREVPRLHFTPRRLRVLCAHYGLARFQDWALDRQIGEFAPQARGRPAGLSQRVAVAANGIAP